MLTGFDPSQAEVLHERALHLFQEGRIDAAIEALGTTLQIRPDHVQAQQNLKLALGRKIHDCGLPDLHSDELDKLAADVCRAQKNPAAWESLSHWYYHRKNFAAAEVCLQNATLMGADLPEAQRARLFLNLAIVALDLRKPNAARGYALEAMRIEPGNPEISRTFAKAHGNFLADTTYDPYVSRENIFENHRAWGEWHRLPGRPYQHQAKRNPSKKIRLGLVSADFYSHPVGIFLFSIMELLDQTRFEIVCYADIRVDDSLTKGIRSRAALWRDITALIDAELAKRIHQDAIDILIDLSGHTGGNRLRAFTLKPAPVQMSFIGYWDTTGVAEMDYLVTDGYTVPLEDERYFTEKVLRLPGSRFCYRPPAFAPEVTLKPEPEAVVLGCFNNDKKLNDEVIACWAQILAAVPGSTLFLKWKTYDAQRVTQLHAQFERFGVSADRLRIEGESTYDVLLGLYNGVDIALDTFPFTGGLTTCDALWMGVPVVTLYGDRPVGRQSASFLEIIGAHELVARTQEDYVAAAVSLALDKSRLRAYKQSLRLKMIQSGLLSPETYTREFEKLLLSCYDAHFETGKAAKSAERIRIVSATRLDRSSFEKDSLLGRALSKYRHLKQVVPQIAYANTQGLPEIYNRAIEEADGADILVFMHDDAAFEDADFPERIARGLDVYDVIGVAGNIRRIANQPAWIFSHIENNHLIWDKEYLSGEIYHRQASGEVRTNYYGKAPQQVKLLDGVLMAARAGTLKKAGVRFDARFDFHFYDVDFCRVCEVANLSMGTWPISLIHASEGNYGGSWMFHYTAYLNKWGN